MQPLYKRNYELVRGCEEGNKELVLSMIRQDASNLNRGLEAACYRGHKELVLLMINKERGFHPF